MGVKFKGAAVWKTFKEEDNSNKQFEAKEQLDSDIATPAQYLEKQVHLAITTEQFFWRTGARMKEKGMQEIIKC